jgi:hypothetical protein
MMLDIEGEHYCIINQATNPPEFCCAEHRREFLAALYPDDAAVPEHPGWQTSPTCVRLRIQLERYEAFHKKPAGTWLLSTRIAKQIVEELRPLLTGPEQQTAGIDDLTGLFGVPVTLVTDLPQGAVLR